MLYNKKYYILFYLVIYNLFAPFASASIITSIKPLGFISMAIADHVLPVEILLPDGASEHHYSLRPSDLKHIKDADLVIWVGPEMEGFMTTLTRTLPSAKNLELINSKKIQQLIIQNTEYIDQPNTPYYNTYNMHLWLSPDIAKQIAVMIHDKLLNIMPQSKRTLDNNLKFFETQLEQLDKNLNKNLTPVRNKGYFVFHDAYSYFEKHYHLLNLGAFTINPNIQPGIKHLFHIRNQLIENKAVCVFTEPQFSPAIINAISRGTNVRKGVLDPLGMGINLTQNSYFIFLSNLSNQYISCLKK